MEQELVRIEKEGQVFYERRQKLQAEIAKIRGRWGGRAREGGKGKGGVWWDRLVTPCPRPMPLPHCPHFFCHSACLFPR